MPSNERVRKPSWLKIKFPSGENYLNIKNNRDGFNLNTICQEGNCPNMGECWNSGTAAFLLMGDTCTRACRFCSTKTAKTPPPLDPNEPVKIARTIKNLKLKYAVLTSVDRDDLSDLGAEHLRQCVQEIKKTQPDVIIELLIPDLQGKTELLDIVAQSGAEVIAHNLEVTRSITKKVRDPRADYDQSLKVLEYIKQTYPKLYTKSSLMVGLGETDEDVISSMKDLNDIGCSFLTIGQYLQPTKKKLPVEEYIHPDKFDWYRDEGKKMGFTYVASGPLVRSSYQAAENFIKAKINSEKCG